MWRFLDTAARIAGRQNRSYVAGGVADEYVGWCATSYIGSDRAEHSRDPLNATISDNNDLRVNSFCFVTHRDCRVVCALVDADDYWSVHELRC